MCKIFINNMLWLALMSIVQNQHLPMLDTVNLCVSLCQELYYSVFFPPFLQLTVLKRTQISGNFKANNGYFLANFRPKLA